MSETATQPELSNEIRSIREIIKDLSKPIAPKHLKTRKQGGTDLTYIDVLKPLFDRHVFKTDDCWLWTGATTEDGYGDFVVARNYGVTRNAHRVSFMLAGNILPDSKILRHTCDNPPCVNPEHLIVGTNKENTQDMISRQRHLKNGAHKNAKITKETALRILELSASGLMPGQIAKELDITFTIAWRVATRRTWKELNI